MDSMSTSGIQEGLTALSSSIQGADTTTDSKDLSFKDMVKSFVSDVNDAQTNADSAINAFASGDLQNSHEVFMAVEKAKLALDLASQIRTQIVNAYNTIMAIQV